MALTRDSQGEKDGVDWDGQGKRNNTLYQESMTQEFDSYRHELKVSRIRIGFAAKGIETNVEK